MSNETKTYGVGDSVEKKNIGATAGNIARLHDDGHVENIKTGETSFDPSKDTVAQQQEDGKLSEQAEGEDGEAKSLSAPRTQDKDKK